MVITGNPGTGKTTVARLITTILFKAGIIGKDKFVEVQRPDLIGEYIGDTSEKTRKVVRVPTPSTLVKRRLSSAA